MIHIKTKSMASSFYKVLGISQGTLPDGLVTEVGVNTVTVGFQGLVRTVMLPTTVTALLKGTASHNQVLASVQEVMQAIQEVSGVESTTNIPDDEPAKTAVTPEPLEVCQPTIEEIMSMKPVSLDTATLLYQPVSGTSSGSVYFVVGIAADLKMAARVSDTMISVRVLCTSDPVIKDLDSLGVSMKKGYLSGHFNCNNTTPRRMLGAILLSLPVEWETAMPKVDLIKGKGK